MNKVNGIGSVSQLKADFIGKHVPTKQTEIIKVMLKEFDDVEAVGIFERP